MMEEETIEKLISIRKKLITEAINIVVAKFNRNIDYEYKLLIDIEADELLVLVHDKDTSETQAGTFSLIFKAVQGNNIVEKSANNAVN